MYDIAPETVTAAPSGRYGFFSPGPGIIQVAQLIRDEWHGTPARYDVMTIVTADLHQGLWIDYGQKWRIDEEDALAFGVFANEALLDLPAPLPKG